MYHLILTLVAIFITPIVADVYSSGLVGLWCYSCVSSQPGCGDEVDWRIHHAITCPEKTDKCVKITERRGGDKFVIRDCLSNLVGLRRDIPADTYEGCRSNANVPKLGVYVRNSIKELDLKRDYWETTEYCFCEFDQWCNSSERVKPVMFMIAICSVIYLYFFAKQ